MEELRGKQEYLFGRICRSYDNLRKLGSSNISINTIDVRIEGLEKAWGTFQDNHDLLLQLIIKEKTQPEYIRDDFFAQAEEAYYNQKTLFLNARSKLQPNASPPAPQAEVGGSSSAPQLPRINLPKFSGNAVDWTSFKDLFSSLVIDNNRLSNVERLHYLKISLTDEAALLLKNISTTSENFAPAWEKLQDRFENSRFLVNAHLNALTLLPAVSKESSAGLKRLIDGITDACSALKILKQPVDQWDAWLVFTTTQKLDSQSRKEWETSLGDSRTPPKFKALESFLQARIRTLEVLEQASGMAGSTAYSESKTTSKNTSIHNRSSSNQKQVFSYQSSKSATLTRKCAFCSRDHSLYTCEAFRDKAPEDRKNWVISKNLCFNCLGRHAIKNCNSSRSCILCRARHHTLLHGTQSSAVSLHNRTTIQNNVTSAKMSSSGETSREVSPVINAISTNNASPQPATSVLLATALVRVKDQFNRHYTVRALIDQGSEASFISEALAQKLRLHRKTASLPVSGVGGKPMGTTRGLISLSIGSLHDSKVALRTDVLVLPRLTAYMPRSQVCLANWSHLSDLQLADPQFSSSRAIDLLLGVDVYSQLILPGLRKGPPGSLVHQSTCFGWVISGMTNSSSSLTHLSFNTCGVSASVDQSLLDSLQRFWVQEEVTEPSASELTPEEKECENLFVESVSRTSEGRIMVKLPWKGDPQSLGKTFIPALRSWQRTERKFQRESDFATLYSAFMNEYERLRHMEFVDEFMDVPSSYKGSYLPHHGVIRESSSSTKLRVVFNGSQKSDCDISLNDLLHTGPNLLPDLDCLLLRFRFHQVVFSTDLEKMFRQILIHPNDRDFQRILWRDKGSATIKIFRLNTVTYGTACAPYLAQRSLRYLASENIAQFPAGSRILMEDTYMDDILSGADSQSEAIAAVHQLIELLKAGGFHTHKWMSNSRELLKTLPAEVLAKQSEEFLQIDPPHLLLGLIWKPREDKFLFQVKSWEPVASISKRIALSQVSQLFDPLGYLAPAIVSAKIFLQSLWLLKIGWDESLPNPQATSWAHIVGEFTYLSKIQIPRWIGYSSAASAIELHGFADASERAFAAVVYLRSQYVSIGTKVGLVAAKTKVAPLKQVSLPRLELCAAVLLVRLVRRILNSLRLTAVPVYLWSDSTVTLSWIRSQPRRWSTFVANRVSEVQQRLPEAHWRHIGSKENPADCASRGLAAKELATFHLWWEGPSLLHSSQFPIEFGDVPAEPLFIPESKTCHNVALQMDSTWDILFRFSKLVSLVRVTAWCLRFSASCGGKFKHLSPVVLSTDAQVLSPSELNRARLFWVLEVQRSAFAQEKKSLLSKVPLPKNSKLVRLNPFLDNLGLLRVGGRLKHSRLSPEARNPLILPSDSHFTQLVIKSCHLKTLHGGTQLTLTTLREEYWVLRGRSLVKSVIKSCISCFRYRASPAYQIMGNLPATRVTRARPFLHSGVDYAGPISLRTTKGRGHKATKGYIAVFVCFAIRAVHLEAVSDYTSEAFLAAYRRFTARRGICSTLTSDRGTNFIGADVTLRTLHSSALKENQRLASLLANDGTEWKFGPPAAPHFGGLWEAAVKSVKHHLRRVIGNSTLTYEEMSTLLCEIEACLNSRPLQAISDDPDDLVALTPSHFLIGSSLTNVPEPSLSQERVSHLSRWQLLCQMRDHFWQRWSREYLQALQSRSKWQRPQPQVQMGDLGLLLNELYPPAKWPLVRVIQLHPGDDGVVRVVTVRTPTSTLKRPITKICFLPREVYSDNES